MPNIRVINAGYRGTFKTGWVYFKHVSNREGAIKTWVEMERHFNMCVYNIKGHLNKHTTNDVEMGAY